MVLSESEFALWLFSLLNPSCQPIPTSFRLCQFSSLLKSVIDFDEKKISEKHFFRFANAQHIVDANYTKKIPAKKTPLPNVYLSNFSQIYPEDRGTNYAVRDGEAIAQTSLED